MWPATPCRTALGLLVALAPPAAEAHVGVQAAELLAGAVHPWFNLPSGLTLYAVTLWTSQHARSTELEPFIAIAACLAAGVAAGLWLSVPALTWLPYLLAFVTGSGVSLELSPARGLRAAAAASLALVAGYLAGDDAAVDVRTPVLFVAGALAGGLVIPLSVAALVAGRGSRALRVGLRILGSWIAAIGLMLLALGLRG